MDLEHVKDVSSWDSGGGIVLDLIELKDGRIIAVSDEIAILYRDKEDLMTGGPSADRPRMLLC